MSQLTLIKTRRFLPLFITQFCGAFNDNAFKNAFVVMIGFGMVGSTPIAAEKLVQISLAIFILPFFLFSATAGQIADKYDKAIVIKYVKIVEVILMLCAAAGFFLQNVWLLMSVLFLMGFQSTIFGPLKYGILPQHLADDELIGGNGLIEMGTFLAILLGTIGGGVLISVENGDWLISLSIILLALVGWFSARQIPSAPASDPDIKISWNFVTQTIRVIRFARQNNSVFIAIIAISWFWFVGAIYLSQLLIYSKDVLHGNDHVFTLFLSVFSFGIGIGSVACEGLARYLPKMSLVLLGGIGLSFFSLDIYFSTGQFLSLALSESVINDFFQHFSGWRILFDLFLIGFFGGLYIVPLYAHMQQRAERRYLSRIISANNILNALFMVVASVLTVLLSALLSVQLLFALLGAVNVLILLFLILTDRTYRQAVARLFGRE
jgi:MFS family permease